MVLTPTFSNELVRRFASRKESTALAVSSASIALTIGSAFSNLNTTPSDSTVDQARHRGWQTAYATAKIAIEVAKESSDVFLPLKAVVGAVSVLIHHCDQTVDNAEAVKDMERRVHSLSGMLSSPIHQDDSAEKARRAQLRRKLEVVTMKLEPLSEQNAFLGFLRNADDSKILTGFVQELANAIMDYQVSVQQGVYERTRDIQDEAQGIRKETQVIHEAARNIRQETRNIRDTTKVICQDTRNILYDTKIIHDDTKNILEASELEILEKLEPVRDAGYQGGHHDRCLPGTRESVLQDILCWAQTPQNQTVFWLNGLAGTGKSTIAQSISEVLAKKGLLGATFFCSRDFLDRRVLKKVFPTLAYQLACHFPHFRDHVIKVIKEDPTIAHTSLISQFENLLVKPLSEGNVSCIILIDALDECIDDQPSSALLSVLGRFVKELPRMKFFITGRPEPRIRTGFRLPLLEPLTQIFLLHEVQVAQVHQDIQLYLTQRLTTIARQRSDLDLPNPWPSDNEIEALTKKSSGLFIFASTMIRFIESEHHEPNERLQLLLSRTSGTSHEGRAGVDSLYSEILLQAFSDVEDPELFVDIRRVLGAIILAFNPLSRKELSVLLGVPTSLISTTLRHLHSVMLIPTDKHQKIRVFHKSFPDFIQDRKRCTNFNFRINPTTYHGSMAFSCLELVKKLKVNPCGLPPFTRNQDVRNLQQLLENKLGGAVRYACSYWARHLNLSWSLDTHTTINLITTMLEGATPWIEVMSLENNLGEVIHAMYSLLDWLDKIPDGKSSLNSLANDYLRLTMYFFHPIQECAQQIYHTALPMLPAMSPLRSVHQRRIADNRICRVDDLLGAPHNWGLLLTTIDVRPKQLTSITTFAQKIVAVCEDIVNVYCAVTFILEQSLPAPERVMKVQESEEGFILYLAHPQSVTSWDLQTGGLIDTFTTQSQIIDMVVSPTGDHVACGLSDDSVVFWDIRFKKEGNLPSAEPLVAIRWLSPVELVVANRNSVRVFNVVADEHSGSISPGTVWGIVTFGDNRLLVGTLKQDTLREFGHPRWSLTTFKHDRGRLIKYSSGSTEAIEGEGEGEAKGKGKSKGKGEGEVEGDGEDDRKGKGKNKGKSKNKSKDKDKFKFVGGGEGEGEEGLESLRNQTRAMNQAYKEWPEFTHVGWLLNLTPVGKKMVCIIQPNGVLALDNDLGSVWKPPLLDTAKSVAVSLNRNLAVQTENSIQVFSVDVLSPGDTEVSHSPHSSHSSHTRVYPLGEYHVVCLGSDRRLTVLELETLETVEFASHERRAFSAWVGGLASICSHGLVADFGVSAVARSWWKGAPLPRWGDTAEDVALLGGVSPNYTRIVTVYGPPLQELRVKDPTNGAVLASLPLEDLDLGTGIIYDIWFHSEAEFYLGVDGPESHFQIPCDIIQSSPGQYPYRIERGEPMYLQPRIRPPYTLDANCEWVLDERSRKICWISPENVRKGNGGHCWAGTSLVMIGEDGIVRKLDLKDPGCRV